MGQGDDGGHRNFSQGIHVAQRILVILGHPSADSLSAALAQSYKEGAQAAGAQVRLLDLGTLAFDPILRAGYRGGASAGA